MPPPASRPPARLCALAGLALAGLLAAGCSAGGPAGTPAPTSGAPAQAASSGSASSRTGGMPVPGGSAGGAPSGSAAGSGAPAKHTRNKAAAPATRKPLAGRTVGIDPGHNGGNFSDPAFLARQVWNGRAMEDCDTTGTETDAGYTEARFTWRVSGFLRQDLRRDGARVVLTRHTNHGVGPCVNTRAAILNHAHASVSIDIHGDGGPPGGRGFAILLPVRDGPDNHVIRSSARFGRNLKRAFLAGTSMPVSNYDGTAGFQPRDDLAGLNLTTEPKVLIEVGNMRNATDARLMISAGFQRRAARAMARAIVAYLTR